MTELAIPSTRFADPEIDLLDDIVRLDEHPIHDFDSPRRAQLVELCQRQLDEEGMCRVEGFLRDDALHSASDEVGVLARKAVIGTNASSVYARSDAETDLADDDPRRIVLSRRVGHVTRDQIAPDAIIHRLYASQLVKRFIADVVGQTRVFEYADPLAGLIATVLPPGGKLPWHYDTNEFVVTVMTQAPEAGGEFRYCHNLRSPGDENFDGLRSVLRGTGNHLVRQRALLPGDLQIFKGRYSLHEITQVEGTRERHVAVLSYADRPGVIGPVDRTRAVYGRVTEAHLLAEEFGDKATDGLIF